MKYKIECHTKPSRTVNSLTEITKSNLYFWVGFQPHLSTSRYIVLTGGSLAGYAITPFSTWTTRRYPEDGIYYDFDTEEELYQWVMDGRIT